MLNRVVLIGANLIAVLLLASPPIDAQKTPASLAGTVASPEEGVMEGVVVSAKQDGSTITVSVVSNKEGYFGFPAQRLPAGHYSLAIRAVGYDLDGPKT